MAKKKPDSWIPKNGGPGIDLNFGSMGSKGKSKGNNSWKNVGIDMNFGSMNMGKSKGMGMGSMDIKGMKLKANSHQQSIKNISSAINSFRPSVQKKRKEKKARAERAGKAAALRQEKAEILADTKNRLEIQKHEEWLKTHNQAKGKAPKKCGWLKKKLGRC